MNMLVRFFIMVSLLKQQQKQQATVHMSLELVTAPTLRDYRILPHDMGFRTHLPNYRYLSFIELFSYDRRATHRCHHHLEYASNRSKIHVILIK